MSKNDRMNETMDAEEQKNTPNSENLNTEDNLNNETTALPDAESAEANALAQLELELSAQKDKYLRLFSDFENYKKRVARERIEDVRMAGKDFLLSVLPVLDDFERALKSFQDNPDTAAMKAGVQLVYNKLKSVTESKGLKSMETEGQLFDPELHEAISSVPASDPEMKGKVIEAIERGYYLHDKVLRHAKVIIAQ